MNIKMIKRFSLLLLLVFFFLGGAQPAAAQLGPYFTKHVTVQGMAWRVRDIDPYNGDVGQYASLALDPVTERPFISYYNATSGRMAMTIFNPEYGGCGPDNLWYCSILGWPNRLTGQYSSIVMTSTGHYAVAGYRSNPAENFLLTGYIDGSGPISIFSELDSAGTSGDLTGWYNSLKLDSQGDWYVAYYKSFPSPAQLRFLYQVGSQKGNCGPSNSLQCDLIDSGTAVGMYASLGFTINDVPYIAYAGVSGQLKLAHRLPVGQTGNCGPSLSWKCEVIDANAKVGSRIAFYIPKCYLGCTDYMRIAYYDSTSKNVKYAYPKTSGNCGPSANWECDVVDNAGYKNTNFSIDNMGVSMDVHNNVPTIAYVNATGAKTVLKVARPANGVGNCGSTPDMFYTWQCETLDDGQRSDGGHDVGAYPSLAVNSAGLATIAYYDATAGDLDLAEEQLQVFLPATFH